MGLAHSPQIVTNGLIFCYDMGNTNKSWLGQPTTNLIGDSMGVYNNVGGDVSITLTATSEKYKGATVYKQVLTPITAGGVSYLTAGNNPGIGVVTGGGGGIANRYTGHAIFYKPTVTMHGAPLYTNYSNIGGWGAGSLGSNRTVDMGDGWFRGEVLWYDTVTRVDGKYWAINPATATLNVPITIYWAAPFKEDRNDSTMVAQYTTGTRTNTQAVIDLTNNNIITAQSLTYNADKTFSFNGSNDYMSIPTSAIPTGNEISIDIFTAWNGGLQPNSIIAGGAGGNQDLSLHLPWSDGNVYWDAGRPFNRIYKATSPSEYTGNHHWVCTKNAATGRMEIYLDGNLWHSGDGLTSTLPTLNSVSIGRYDNEVTRAYYYKGNIFSIKIYNRALSALEVQQNFNALRGRFGI